MLNKLHTLIGLKSKCGELEATTAEKVAVYAMYASLALITLLVVNIG